MWVAGLCSRGNTHVDFIEGDKYNFQLLSCQKVSCLMKFISCLYAWTLKGSAIIDVDQKKNTPEAAIGCWWIKAKTLSVPGGLRFFCQCVRRWDYTHIIHGGRLVFWLLLCCDLDEGCGGWEDVRADSRRPTTVSALFCPAVALQTLQNRHWRPPVHMAYPSF
jgi:hypothetical protein